MENKNKSNIPAFNIFKVCPICGEKKFVFDASEYVYKIGYKYYCSWTCYRKAQREMEEKHKKRKSNHIMQR